MTISFSPNARKTTSKLTLYLFSFLMIDSIYALYFTAQQPFKNPFYLVRFGLLYQLQFAPYAINVIVWCIFLIFIFYPKFKYLTLPLFLIMYSTQELLWNTTYLLDRLPYSITWLFGTYAHFWFFYILTMIFLPVWCYYMWHRNFSFNFKRYLLLAIPFFVIYYLSGVPIVLDFARPIAIFTPINIIWEEVFNIILLIINYLSLKPKLQVEI